jgi:hypothetical protein
MRRVILLGLMAFTGSLLVSGCALKDPRDSYAYGRLADGLWDADYDLLLDWNFPTSANQPPLEAPRRFRPERASIGTPWARRAPFQLPPADDKGASAQPTGAREAIARNTAQRATPASPAPRTDVARLAGGDSTRLVR